MTQNDIAFYERHIGLSEQDINDMLEALGENSLKEFCNKAIPDSIKIKKPLNLPDALSESEALALANDIINKNNLHKSFIGQGYHGTFTPPVIMRNLFENPAWYTAYTPYQAEISQGRLEMLFYFQTLICELTGLPVANCSLLDEGTAVAEACSVAYRAFKGKRDKIAIIGKLHPQTMAVVNTRTEFNNIVLSHFENKNINLENDLVAIILPLTDSYGALYNYSELIKQAKKNNTLVIFVADPLALTILESPGKLGADIVVGTTQRFGVPMGFGGPAAAYMAVSDALKRLIPGRIIGLSKDKHGNPAYRLSLQTREQHIRREKATSNICTSQVLLANMAAAYAIWHGAQGLQNIAYRIHNLACKFAIACKNAGYALYSETFFDCVTVNISKKACALTEKAYENGLLLRIIDENNISINFDETSTIEDYKILLKIFNLQDNENVEPIIKKNQKESFLQQSIFNSIKSETDMMRLLRRLSDKDLALDRAMIPLGSCTMKMNAAVELMPLSFAKWNNIHPLANFDAAGYFELIENLEVLLSNITGFSKISFQPNSGAQGEYAGLLVIKKYLASKNEEHRNICLIPSSAHGTNPASAQMAGFDIITVNCNENGDIDVQDLSNKAELYKNKLAALMITYPSTHGVYEENIINICNVIHENGGQVYLDGANLNAMVGLSRPIDLGADVCHMNLHKTFAIPHGGGGPGCGPIGVVKHLEEFLPKITIEADNFMISSAPFGSASILLISWMYIRLMGAKGLTKATQCAILSANYLAKKLTIAGYEVLYSGKNGFVAHEAIIDTRIIKNKFKISEEDIAKRLIDYGFHAPTMSFPVSGTLMIEPTESESKKELDRFCNALASIYKEIQKIANNEWSLEDNPLVNAPHTAEEALIGEWHHCYSREVALYPFTYDSKYTKYFPPVARIDNVAGDKNLICNCGSTSDYIK